MISAMGKVDWEYRQGKGILNREVRDCFSDEVETGQRLEIDEGVRLANIRRKQAPSSRKKSQYKSPKKEMCLVHSKTARRLVWQNK